MRILKLMIVLALASNAAFGSVFSELSPADQAKILNWEFVIQYFPNDDTSSSWPNSAAYQRVAVPPEEAAAVFTDFNAQKDYIKSLEVSSISQELSPSSLIVDYKIKIPAFVRFILPKYFKDTSYSMQNDLTYSTSTNTYEVHWVLTRSNFLKEIRGHATFEPLEGGTLIAYVNEMSPVAPALNDKRIVGQLQKGSQEAMQQIVGRIYDEHNHKQDLLQAEIKTLRKALGQ